MNVNKDGLDTVCWKKEDTKKNTPSHWCLSNMNGKDKCTCRIRDGTNSYKSIQLCFTLWVTLIVSFRYDITNVIALLKRAALKL